MNAGLPLIGDRFPELEVNTTHGVKKLPQDYAGQWFVLFSHPGDFTPVCTTEFIAFERLREEFEALDCSLIGLSVDQVFSHIKWVEWIKENRKVDVQFPVIADELGRVSSALGMIHPNKGTNTVRSVFIVDDKGIIRLFLYYPQEIGRNMDEILRALRALQTHEKHKVALPANCGNSPTAPGVLRERLPLQCLTSLPVYVRYLLPILAPGDDFDIRWELMATLSYTPDPPRHHSGHSPPGLVHTGLVSPQAI